MTMVNTGLTKPMLKTTLDKLPGFAATACITSLITPPLYLILLKSIVLILKQIMPSHLLFHLLSKITSLLLRQMLKLKRML